jgi:hypothetical protein
VYTTGVLRGALRFLIKLFLSKKQADLQPSTNITNMRQEIVFLLSYTVHLSLYINKSKTR